MFSLTHMYFPRMIPIILVIPYDDSHLQTCNTHSHADRLSHRQTDTHTRMNRCLFLLSQIILLKQKLNVVGQIVHTGECVWWGGYSNTLKDQTETKMGSCRHFPLNTSYYLSLIHFPLIINIIIAEHSLFVW